MAAEIVRFIHSWCETTEFGRVMTVTLETSRFRDGPMVESVGGFKVISQIRAKNTSSSAMVEPKVGSRTLSNQTQSVFQRTTKLSIE